MAVRGILEGEVGVLALRLVVADGAVPDDILPVVADEAEIGRPRGVAAKGEDDARAHSGAKVDILAARRRLRVRQRLRERLERGEMLFHREGHQRLVRRFDKEVREREPLLRRAAEVEGRRFAGERRLRHALELMAPVRRHPKLHGRAAHLHAKALPAVVEEVDRHCGDLVRGDADCLAFSILVEEDEVKERGLAFLDDLDLAGLLVLLRLGLFGVQLEAAGDVEAVFGDGDVLAEEVARRLDAHVDLADLLPDGVGAAADALVRR